MNRRTLLKMAAAAPVVTAASRLSGPPSLGCAQPTDFTPRPGTWRTFEVTTRVEVVKPAGVTRVWLPVPSVDSEYPEDTGEPVVRKRQGHAAPGRRQVRRHHALRRVS